MDGGPLRINPPNSHPSNLIHKEAIKGEQNKEALTIHTPSSPPAPAPCFHQKRFRATRSVLQET